MRTKVMVEPVTLTTVEYSGGHVYRNGRLERVCNPYGYWAKGTFHYHITDHQGNIRAIIAEDGTLEEINNYYPYGGLMGAAGTMGVQPHKYGAKELDRENGLDLYDSHARWYDPLLARTTTQDPLAEKYRHLSPYTWCAANPIRFTDPCGMIIEDQNGYIDNILSFYSTSYSNILKLLSCNTSLDEKTKSLLNSCAYLYKTKLSELEDLKESDQIYRIEFSSDVNEGEADTNYDPKSGKLVTRINSSIQKSTGLVAHESEHWVQFETGELSYNYITGSAGYLYDMTDEITAYNTQSVVEKGIGFKIYDDKENRIPNYNDYNASINAASQNKTNNVFRKKKNGKRITIKSFDF